MAALKYIGQFESYTGLKYQVSIYDEDGTGSSLPFKLGPDGFELIYEGDTGDPWKPLTPSRVEFVFNVEDQTAEDFIIECATARPGRFLIYITESSAGGNYTDTMYWQGFLQGEGIQISDAYFPYEVTLSATDLSYWDEVPYNDVSTVTGVGTGVDHLLKCLDYAGHSAFASAHGFDDILQTTINWRGVSMSSGGDPVEKTGVDYRSFYSYDGQNSLTYSSCREVAEALAKLYGARLVQSKGLFRLQQFDQLVESTNLFFNYENDKTLSSSGTVDESYDIDLVDNFRLTGGSTSFYPGVKSAEREYKYPRNYLEGQDADQDNPLSFVIGDIPLLNYLVSSQAPRFTIKFNITYKILTVPDIGTGGVFGLGWDVHPGKDEWEFVPLWRMSFYATGGTDAVQYWYSHAVAERNPSGIEYVTTESRYIKMLGTKKNWYQLSNSLYISPTWLPSTDPIANRYFEIIDEEGYVIPTGIYGTGDYEPEERTITVEATIPYMGSPATAQDMEDLTITLDLHEMYNRWAQQWTRQAGGITLSDHIEWKVDSFELIVHGDILEEKPETARKYKVTSPDGYRKKLELDDNILTGLDKRTWHSIQVHNGTKFQDGQLWYRGTDSLNFKLLNYLSVREQVAMNRAGLRIYQGALVTKGTAAPSFHSVITSMSKRWMIVSGTFNAKRDEWLSVAMVELTRDAADLTYTEVKTDSGAPTRSALPGGNYSGQGSGGAEDVSRPQYEFATAQTGSTYTITGFDTSSISAYTDSEINEVLWVFQDSGKLRCGNGYTKSGNVLTFTYALESADIEVYYYE